MQDYTDYRIAPDADQPPLQLKPDETALIVVDMQNAFIRDEGFMAKLGLDISRCKETVQPIRGLIDACHGAGVPIVFTRMSLRADYKDAGLFGVLFPGAKEAGAMVANSWDAAIIDELKPIDPDWILDKTRYSAFYNTNLDDILRSLRTKTVIMTGVTTNICVESTLRDAFFRDYFVVLPVDGTAAVAEAMEAGTFLTVKYGFGRLTTSEEILEALKVTV